MSFNSKVSKNNRQIIARAYLSPNNCYCNNDVVKKDNANPYKNNISTKMRISQVLQSPPSANVNVVNIKNRQDFTYNIDSLNINANANATTYTSYANYYNNYTYECLVKNNKIINGLGYVEGQPGGSQWTINSNFR